MKRLFISALCATALTGVAAQTPADTTQVVYDITEGNNCVWTTREAWTICSTMTRA